VVCSALQQQTTSHTGSFSVMLTFVQERRRGSVQSSAGLLAAYKDVWCQRRRRSNRLLSPWLSIARW